VSPFEQNFENFTITGQHCGVLLVLIRNIGHRTLPKNWVSTFLVRNVHNGTT